MLRLVNAESSQFKFSLLILPDNAQFLLLALQLVFELLREHILVILQFEGSLLLKTFLLFPHGLLLLTVLLAGNLLRFAFELLFELGNLFAEHSSAIFGFILDFELDLGQLLFISALLLPLEFLHFVVVLLLQLSLFLLKFALEVSLDSGQLSIKLGLHLGFFLLETVYVAPLALQLLVLLLAELLDFKFVSLFFAFFDRASHAFVTLSHLDFLGLNSLFHVSFVVAQLCLHVELNLTNLPFFLRLQFLFESG